MSDYPRMPKPEKKMPRMSRALFEFGGPGRNRTTDTRIFNSDRPSSFLLLSKTYSVYEKFCACAVIFFNAVKKYLDSISTMPLSLFAKIF